MLLNRGAVPGQNGRRILSRLSVEAMTTNQITPAQATAAQMFLGPNRGWGFGGSVVMHRDGISAVPGQYGWTGGYGTSWSVDPAEQMTGVLLTQRLWDSPAGPTIYHDFWTLAYQSIDD
jgi:CubicO group peptidase (beta-lactamase class C family)